MSYFEVQEVDSTLKAFPTSLIKPIDDKWKNFTPCCIPNSFAQTLGKIKEFEVFEDDVFLTGYPRSGTTIAAEMLWLMMNNFDFDKATSLVTDDRVPGLEFDDSTQMIQKGKLMNTFDTLTRPRSIKTHLPVQFLPDEVWIKKPKMIYVSRNPRDVVVSNYHFWTHYDKSLTMETMFEDFLNDNFIMTPYREHRLNYWNIPDYPNILYLTYESMTSNTDEAIEKVAQFLEVKVSGENFEKLKDHLSFDKMKMNKGCNNELYFTNVNEMMKQKTNTDDFIRRGKIGGFKDEMLAEWIEKFDKWLAEEDELEAGFQRKV